RNGAREPPGSGPLRTGRARDLHGAPRDAPRPVALPHSLRGPDPARLRPLRGVRYTEQAMGTAVLTRSPVHAAWLGRISYDAALLRQAEAAARVAAGGPEELLLLEHEPVFTLGRNASAADILLTPELRAKLGIAVREADRGGKVTYHGPGQLVGYPILDLSPDRRDVKRYVT